MMNLRERSLQLYFKFMGLFFYIYLFGVLSLGRGFSVLNIKVLNIPIFITEIFILLNVPLLLCKYKSLMKLPRVFLRTILIFFIFGCAYLFVGLFQRNLFVLRDITLCIYILFLPITLINLSTLKRVKLFFIVIILANVINLGLGICALWHIYPSIGFYDFMGQVKLFNLGLYNGIACAFIISFYDSIKPKAYRLVALILSSFDIFMMIMICKRSLWVAIIVLFVFLTLTLKKEFFKFLLVFIPIFIFVSSSMLYFSSKHAPDYLSKSLHNKIEGVQLFINKTPLLPAPVKAGAKEAPPAPNLFKPEPVKVISSGDSYVNIIWRINIWKQSIKFAMESPIIGRGFGVYPAYQTFVISKAPHSYFLDSGIIPAHNHLITVFLKMGILGLGLFLFIIIYVFIYGMLYLGKCYSRFIKNLLIAALGIFIFWNVFALFFDLIDSPPTSIFLWITMGIIFAAVEIDKNLTRNKKEGVGTVD